MTSWKTTTPTEPFDTRTNTNFSVWDNFENVEAKQARNEFLPPDLNTVAEIVELKVVASQKNRGQQVFVCILKVEDEEGKITFYDWVAKMNEDVYLRNIKALICALNPEADPSSFGREVMEHLTGPEQPCRGLKVRLKTEMIQTQRGNNFTKVSWYTA